MNDTSADNSGDLKKRLEEMKENLRKYLKVQMPRNLRWTEGNIETTLRANGYCEYCGADLLRSPDAFWASECDHVLPRKHGGNDDYDTNLALVCRKCNSIRGGSLPDGMDAEGMKHMELPERIAAVRPVVLERRREQQVLEVYAKFREVLELKRAQPKGGGK